jgi:anti-anti-sigma regulatory factor
MPTFKHDRTAAPRHEGLLPTSLANRRTRIAAWTQTAVDRGDKIVVLTADPDRDVIAARPDATVATIGIGDLHPAATAVQLVQRTLDESFQGLSILIWADNVITETSAEFHSAIETELADLCDHHPVSVLCCYDRNGAGTGHLDMAVTHHGDGLHEQQLTLRHFDDNLYLDGEIDMNNLDVLATALRVITSSGTSAVRIHLRRASFLSAAALQALGQHTASFRDHGGRVELHGTTPQIPRFLQLLQLQPLPGLDIATDA